MIAGSQGFSGAAAAGELAMAGTAVAGLGGMRLPTTACLAAVATGLVLSIPLEAAAQKRANRIRARATSAGLRAGETVARTSVRGLRRAGTWLGRRGSTRVSIHGSEVTFMDRNGEAIVRARDIPGSATLRLGRHGHGKPSRSLELQTIRREQARSFSLRLDRPDGPHLERTELTLGAGPVGGSYHNSVVIERFTDGSEVSHQRYLDGARQP